MNNPTQDYVNGIMARMSEERKASAANMSLGGLIEVLKTCDPTALVVLEDGRGVSGFMSYRGYYEDLAIEPVADAVIVSCVLGQAQRALGEVFEGYKGGEYPMHKNTLLWVSHYGTTGDKLTGVRHENGRVLIETQTDD